MARELSLAGKRSARTEGGDGEVWVTLFRAEHASLDEPVLLSSDATVRVSTDPLVYGTWHQGELYRYALSGAVLPDDDEDASPTVTLSMEVPGPETIETLRKILSPEASVTITTVRASAPDVIEDQYVDWKLVNTPLAEGSLQLVCMPIDLDSEPWPKDRMTIDRFPGLRRT